jgi:hypothetical protein
MAPQDDRPSSQLGAVDVGRRCRVRLATRALRSRSRLRHCLHSASWLCGQETLDLSDDSLRLVEPGQVPGVRDAKEANVRVPVGDRLHRFLELGAAEDVTLASEHLHHSQNRRRQDPPRSHPLPQTPPRPPPSGTYSSPPPSTDQLAPVQPLDIGAAKAEASPPSPGRSPAARLGTRQGGEVELHRRLSVLWPPDL